MEKHVVHYIEKDPLTTYLYANIIWCTHIGNKPLHTASAIHNINWLITKPFQITFSSPYSSSMREVWYCRKIAQYRWSYEKNPIEVKPLFDLQRGHLKVIQNDVNISIIWFYTILCTLASVFSASRVKVKLGWLLLSKLKKLQNTQLCKVTVHSAAINCKACDVSKMWPNWRWS